MDFTAERKAMVDSQVRVNDVTNHEIHLAMMETPRESFCAPERAFAAYSEEAVTIAGFLGNVIPVILGNLVGGSVLVALVYYLIYRRPAK